MTWLFTIMVSLGFTVAFAQTAPPMGACASDLQALPAYRLGIGVLVETTSGKLRLGTSPYAGSLHNAIVDKLLETYTVKQILWMGELRFRTVNGLPEILEANETSGYYSSLRKSGLPHEGRNIPVQNSVMSIPQAFRATGFTGHSFDPLDMRLARELRYVKGDVRHSIGSSLQMLLSQTVILSFPHRSGDEKRAMVDDFRVQAKDDLILLRWLVVNLIEDGRVTSGEMESFLKLISLYENPRAEIADLQATSIEQLDQQIQRLSLIVNAHHGQMVVDFY